MTNTELALRLLRHLLYLLLSLGGAALATLLVATYYEYFPSVSSEGSAWGNLGDGLSIIFAALVFLLAALIWWTRRMIADMARYRAYRFFVAALIVLTLAPWMLLAAYWIRMS